ncbi:hypothetical protein N8575_01990 [Gammaproteobacteria bacterium]|nr:hypothetical protein [Gammaproteobacteria bacterium]
MNNNPRFVKKRLCQLVAAGLLLGAGSSVYANDFSLVDNQFTISETAASAPDFSVTATLGIDGVLDTTGASLPQFDLSNAALNSGIPTFSFTIDSDGLTANTTHSFKIGLSISDDANPTTRRFEAYLGTLTLAVDGSKNVTGTIPSQNLNVRAKKGSATFYQAINNPSVNGPVSISGGTITLSGSEAVTLLKAQGNDALDAVLDNFTLDGTFTFRVVIEETTAGSAKLGVRSDSAFTAVPRVGTSCALDSNSTVGNVFQLITDTGFTNAYVVQGRFSSGQSAANTAATPFTESCVASGGGGAAAPVVEDLGDLEEEAEELAAVLDDIVDIDTSVPLDDAVLTQLDDLAVSLEAVADSLEESVVEELLSGVVSTATVTSTTSLATKSAATSSAISNAIASGTEVSTSSVLGALKSGAKSSSTASKVSGSTTDTTAKAALAVENTTILNSSATMLSSLASKSTALTTAEADDVRTASKNLVSTALSLADTVVEADLKNVAAQATNILVAQASLGIAADTALIDSVSSVSEQLGSSLITSLLTNDDGEAPTTEEITESLTNDTALFESVLDVSLPVPPSIVVTLAERTDLVTIAFPTLSAAAVTRSLAATAKIVNPQNITLKSGVTALSFLDTYLTTPAVVESSLLGGIGSRRSVAALLAGEAEVVVDAVTGAITISVPGETYAGMVLAVRTVPASVPNGLRLRTDGRFTLVSDGTAMDIAATAFSVGGFIELAETAGFGFTQNDNASFSLDLGSDQTFVGAFAYDNLADADIDSTCGTISVTNPEGLLNSASYAFGINCANGVTQKVVPFAAESNFLPSLRAAGMAATANRSTGVISVNGVELLKPGFFTAAPTTDELTYHAANADSLGIAMQILDINDDGIDDYKVISATTVQIMYGVE